MKFDTKLYYPIEVPSIYDIARWIMGLGNMYPGLTLKVTKRDVASSFRFLRFHRDLPLVMVAEFPAAHVHFPDDLVCFYLAMPFGWNGEHAHIAFFGDSFTIAHTQCRLSKDSSTLMRHSYRSVLYVDDGISVEIDAPERLFATTQCWEHLVRGVLGLEAINAEKLGEEGTWEAQQILLRFVFNLEILTITLPGEKSMVLN